MLYTSCSLETDIPWGSLERTLSIVRVAWKLILSLSFAMDKLGNFRGEVGLIQFGMGAYISYHRLTSAIIFDKSVYRATAFYEIYSTWLFLTVSLHTLLSNSLSLSLFFVYLVSGAFIVTLALMI